jgi:hypothetical protein
MPVETPAREGVAVPTPVASKIDTPAGPRLVRVYDGKFDGPQPSLAMKTVDVGMHAAMMKFLTEIAAFAVLSLASSIIAKKRKKVERGLRWNDRVRVRSKELRAVRR